ncbi:MAG: hypothetical protein ACFFBD_25580, partial [Candidatus Hodarchaeota archaeon]
NIRGLIEKAKKAHAEFLRLAGLTLKPVRQKKGFMEILEKENPELLTQYEEIYGDNNIYGHPNTSKTVNVMKLGHKLLKEYGLPDQMPRYIPEGRIKRNLRVAEHLFYIEYLTKYIHGWKRESVALNKAAHIIDKYPRDIGNLSEEELLKLGIEAWLIPEIQAFLQTGSCPLWQKVF